jgi:CheY-like chemotaxis protein
MDSLLLIDDDVQLCRLLSKFFASHDFKLDAVHDGRSGLLRAQQRRHELVLLDVMLPAMDGLEVLTQLRNRTTIPVIMLTARSADNDKIAGRLTELLEGLIQITRANSGIGTQPLNDVALDGLINELIEDCAIEATARGKNSGSGFFTERNESLN